MIALLRHMIHSGLNRVLLLFLLSAPLLAWGQEVTASFDSAVVETGQALRLTVSVPANVGTPESLDISDWTDKFPPENILEQSGWQRIGDFWQNEIKLIAFDADTLQLPPVRVGFQHGKTLSSNPLELTVRATPAPEELSDMADIKGIHKEPGLWTDYWQWFAIIGGLLALAAIWFWLATRKKRQDIAASRQVKLQPHELALRKIKVLEAKQYWQQGMYPEYYGALSYILREYLEGRYGFPALESVAEDILKKLPPEGFPENLLPPLGEFFLRSDLAKFAQAVPPEQYHPKALEFVKNCIQDTTMPKSLIAQP
jgi:hypothetical protein